MSQILKSRRMLITSAVIVLLALAGVIAYPSLKSKWEKPLGEAIVLPTYTPTIDVPTATLLPSATLFPTDTAVPGEPTFTPAPPTDTPTPTATNTPTPAPLCGGPATSMVLAIGADNRDNTYLYGLADVIRVVRVDFVTPKITSLTIPRDLWVNIPEISDHYGITEGKINQAYLFGGPGMGYYDGPGGGPGLLALTLDTNFGLRVEHYGAVNMQTFVKMVDAVGGVDVVLDHDVDGTAIDETTEDLPYFKAGFHHLNGTNALALARIRKRYGVSERVDNQTLVVCALYKKLKDPAIVLKIPELISAFVGRIQTDLSPQQISQMACLLPYMKQENIIFTSLPKDIVVEGRVFDPHRNNYTYAQIAENEAVRSYVQQFMEGTWPSQPDEPSCPD